MLEATSLTGGSGLYYFSKSVPKTAPGNLTIEFGGTYADPSFEKPPIIIVTAYWKGKDTQVGHVPTVTYTSQNSCIICSENYGPDYYVNVLALSQSQLMLGALPIQLGATPKETESVNVTFQTPLPGTSKTLVFLSPVWYQEHGVGSLETVTAMSDSGVSIISHNHALPRQYAVNYLAIPLATSQAGGQMFETGSVNKTGKGKIKVYFSEPFNEAPIVYLTPNWPGATMPVGSVPTLDVVTNEYFEMASFNGLTDYFVNWMAISNQ